MRGAVDLLAQVDWTARCGGTRRGFRRFLTAAEPVSTSLLARIAADVAPAAGEDGPAAVLGPWAEGPAPDPWALRARQIALAAGAFARPPGEERTPVRAWSTLRSGRPPRRLRESVHAVARTPWWPWRLQPWRDGWRLEPCAGWGDDLLPDAPIDLSHAGGVAGGPAAGRVALVRVVWVTDLGWRAILPLVLPEIDEACLLPAVDAVHAHVGCGRPRSETLASGGHLLAGALHRMVAPG